MVVIFVMRFTYQPVRIELQYVVFPHSIWSTMMTGRKLLLCGILLGCSITYLTTLLTMRQIQSLEQDTLHNVNVPLGWEQWDFTHSYKNTELPGNQTKHVKSIVLFLNTSNLKQYKKQNCLHKREVSTLMAWVLEDGTPISWRLPLTLPRELSCQLARQSNPQKQMHTPTDLDLAA